MCVNLYVLYGKQKCSKYIRLFAFCILILGVLLSVSTDSKT